MTFEQARNYINTLAKFYYNSGQYEGNDWIFWLIANEVHIIDKEFNFWGVN